MTEAVGFDQALIDDFDDNFTKPELQAACDQFGVETKKTFNKAQLIEALLGDGVEPSLVRGFTADNKDEEEEFELDVPAAPVEEEDDDEELVLVRMIRANNTYEIRGYTFKQAHPFVLVKPSDADYLVEKDGGFRVASPKEAKEYYS